jgi:hypothetical protein
MEKVGEAVGLIQHLFCGNSIHRCVHFSMWTQIAPISAHFRP